MIVSIGEKVTISMDNQSIEFLLDSLKSKYLTDKLLLLGVQHEEHDFDIDLFR